MSHHSRKTDKIAKFSILDQNEILNFGRNLDEVLDEIGDFGWMKNDIWARHFLVA